MKTEIIQTAMHLFKEEGFENTSIVQICKAVKITRNTFYYYFKSKNDLISCFFETALSSSPEVFTQVLAEDSDWKRYLKLYELHINFLTIQGNEFTRLVINSILNGESQLTQKYIVTEEWCIPILAHCIQEETVRQDYSPAELNSYANQLCLGIVLVWCASNASFDLWPRCRQGIESLFLTGEKRSIKQ